MRRRLLVWPPGTRPGRTQGTAFCFWFQMPSAESLRNLGARVDGVSHARSTSPPKDWKAPPRHRQPNSSLLQQPAFTRAPSPNPVANCAVSQERDPVLPGSRSPITARRGLLRPPSADEACSKKSQLRWTGSGPATQNTGPRLRKEQKQGTAWDESPPLNSASEESTASLATTQFFASLLGHLCTATTIRKQWRVYSQQRRAQLSVERCRTAWQRLKFPVLVERSPEMLFSPA